jgi:hypothetical protein
LSSISIPYKSLLILFDRQSQRSLRLIEATYPVTSRSSCCVGQFTTCNLFRSTFECFPRYLRSKNRLWLLREESFLFHKCLLYHFSLLDSIFVYNSSHVNIEISCWSISLFVYFHFLVIEAGVTFAKWVKLVVPIVTFFFLTKNLSICIFNLCVQVRPWAWVIVNISRDTVLIERPVNFTGKSRIRTLKLLLFFWQLLMLMLLESAHLDRHSRHRETRS